MGRWVDPPPSPVSDASDSLSLLPGALLGKLHSAADRLFGEIERDKSDFAAATTSYAERLTTLAFAYGEALVAAAGYKLDARTLGAVSTLAYEVRERERGAFPLE